MVNDKNDGETVVKLLGKSNFIEWNRLFRRAAKAEDAWITISGKENKITEPKMEDCIVYADGTTGPTTRSASDTQKPSYHSQARQHLLFV